MTKRTQGKKAVFLDRDGTVTANDEKITGFYAEWLFGFSAEAIARIKKAGFLVIMVSNQARVAYGEITEQQVKETNATLITELEKKGAKIDASYYCPHHPKNERTKIAKYAIDCNCRKPKTGMLEAAQKKFGIDFSKSFVIGDDSCDIEMGRRAGCKTILVLTGHAGKDGHFEAKPDFVAKDLLEAAELITLKKIND